MDRLIEQHEVVCGQLAKSMERIAELEAALAQIEKLDQIPNVTAWGMTNAVGVCAKIARAALRKFG